MNDETRLVDDWSCPDAGVCPTCGDVGRSEPPNWRAWVDAHNTYRCMHGVPGLSWKTGVSNKAKKEFFGAPKALEGRGWKFDDMGESNNKIVHEISTSYKQKVG